MAETAALRTWVEGHVAELTAAATPGVFAKHSYDVPLLCAQLSCLHPNDADWRVLANFLSETKVPVQQKRTAAKMLAANSDDVPAHVRTLIASTARSARTSSGPSLSPFDPPIGGAVVELELAVSDGELEDRRTLRAELLTGSAAERQDLADLLALTNETTGDDVLLALIGDADNDVRQHALTSLTRRIAQRRDGELSVLHRAVGQGEFAARAVLRGLFAARTVPQPMKPLVDSILTHPSAMIRKAAQSLDL